MDDCSAAVVASSRLSVGVGGGGVSLPFASTITDTVFPAGVDGELAVICELREGVGAVWRPKWGDAVPDRSVSSMVVLSDKDASAVVVAICRAIIVFRSASAAASFTLAAFPIGRHSLREFAVDVRRLRVRIIEPVVISSPNPSS